MDNDLHRIIASLIQNKTVSEDEYKYLIDRRDSDITLLLADEAVKTRKRFYGNSVFIRGLIEIGNVCKNDCLYCGIRRSNAKYSRFRLTSDEILSCCADGYSLGFRTFVLQGGEDPHFSDEFICNTVSRIKSLYPDCAVTLSLGERSEESYRAMKNAGADRYLLRHETADKAHYEKLHPSGMSFDNRINCLKTLRSIGYQVGCGFMVGSPYQTSAEIAKDLAFIGSFRPDMCGIGPFIPHKDTPFSDYPAGSAELTCFLLSIIRLICPTVLLPATTALGTVVSDGRERGILSGANVVMPNLSPAEAREKYTLYNGKISSGAESAQKIALLSERMRSIGYQVVCARGDVRR